MSSPDRRRRAFTLLEVVIASFIFVVVLGALVTVWVHHDRAQSDTKGRLIAGLLAEETMERCVASGFFLLEEIAEEGPRTREVLLEEEGQGSPISFTTTVEVEENAEEDLRVVTVKVQYQEREEAKSLSLVHAFYRTF